MRGVCLVCVVCRCRLSVFLFGYCLLSVPCLLLLVRCVVCGVCCPSVVCCYVWLVLFGCCCLVVVCCSYDVCCLLLV